MKLTLNLTDDVFQKLWETNENIFLDLFRLNQKEQAENRNLIEVSNMATTPTESTIQFVLALQDKLGYYITITNDILEYLPQEEIMGILRKYIPIECDEELTFNTKKEYDIRTNITTAFDILYRKRNCEAIAFMLNSEYVKKYILNKTTKHYLILDLKECEYEELHKRVCGKLGTAVELKYDFGIIGDTDLSFSKFSSYYLSQLEVLGVICKPGKYTTKFIIPEWHEWDIVSQIIDIVKLMIKETYLAVMTPYVNTLNKVSTKKMGEFMLSPLGLRTNDGEFHAFNCMKMNRYFSVKKPITSGADKLGAAGLEFLLKIFK